MTELVIQGEPIAIRAGVRDDAGFVFTTWIKSELALLTCPRDVVRRWREPVIERHIARDHILVACAPELPRTIYGWVCHDGPVVLYAYVAFAMRREGLGRALLRAVEQGGHHDKAASR